MAGVALQASPLSSQKITLTPAVVMVKKKKKKKKRADDGKVMDRLSIAIQAHIKLDPKDSVADKLMHTKGNEKKILGRGEDNNYAFCLPEALVPDRLKRARQFVCDLPATARSQRSASPHLGEMPSKDVEDTSSSGFRIPRAFSVANPCSGSKRRGEKRQSSISFLGSSSRHQHEQESGNYHSQRVSTGSSRSIPPLSSQIQDVMHHIYGRRKDTAYCRIK